jgi:sulfur carrier protein
MELSLKITVNGEACNTAARTLEDLCRELGLSEAKIATARNGDFVAAKARAAVALADGDAIELLSPRQGG